MKKIKNIVCIILAFVFVLSFSACKKEKFDIGHNSNGAIQTAAPSAGEKEAYLYVGRGEAYRSYKINYSGALSADMLIEKLAELTGWNLNLTKPVVSDKSKMSVDFAKNSSVATGRAEKEKDAFEIDSKKDLVYTILDSVYYTLKQNFGVGSPDDALEITFSCEGASIEAGGKSVDMQIEYTPDLVLEYSKERHIEFLTNRLSNYYDTPNTEYVKTGEEFDEGERLFVYEAKYKDTGRVIGTLRFPSDLSELEIKEDDGEYETIWEKEMFGD